MKFPLLTMSLFATLLTPMKSSEAKLDYDRLLACIGEIEQGDPNKPGGNCNISYLAWETVAPDLPFHMSANESVCRPVCKKQLLWLVERLKEVNCKVNPQTLGTCWRLGFQGARRVGFKHEQGVRTSALYFDKDFLKKP